MSIDEQITRFKEILSDTSSLRSKVPTRKKRFAVYFEQINQSRFEVTAETEDKAIEKAARMWLRENKGPSRPHVEEIKEGDWPGRNRP